MERSERKVEVPRTNDTVAASGEPGETRCISGATHVEARLPAELGIPRRFPPTANSGHVQDGVLPVNGQAIDAQPVPTGGIRQREHCDVVSIDRGEIAGMGLTISDPLVAQFPCHTCSWGVGKGIAEAMRSLSALNRGPITCSSGGGDVTDRTIARAAQTKKPKGAIECRKGERIQ